jgi:hypothetical protein
MDPAFDPPPIRARRVAQTGDLAACAVTAPVKLACGQVRPAGRLRSGDLLATLDGRAEPVLWASPPLVAPLVEAAAGAGAGAQVTPSTFVHMDAPAALFGGEGVLCPAGASDLPARWGTCVAILLPRFALIRIGGAWCGGYQPDPAALAALPADARASLRAQHPRVLHVGGQAAYMPDLPVIGARERALRALVTARGSDRADRTSGREAG